MRLKHLLLPAVLANVGYSAPPPTAIQIRQNEKNPDDLSYIQKIAAIGDSYSAGIGAGDRLQGILSGVVANKFFPLLGDDWKCEYTSALRGIALTIE